MSANNGKIDSKLEQLKVFLLGMWEFRSDFAHKLTFRYFDN